METKEIRISGAARTHWRQFSCGASAALDDGCDPITANLYDASQTGELPREAVLASLGCGNPTALAQLNPGETVLDLLPAAVSTCCCLRGASVPPAEPAVST